MYEVVKLWKLFLGGAAGPPREHSLHQVAVPFTAAHPCDRHLLEALALQEAFKCLLNLAALVLFDLAH